MNTLRLLSGIALVGGALLVNQMVVAVPGPLAIATEPLFLKNRVKPAFIMAVDDSGSMNLETLFETLDGALYWGGTGAAASFYDAAGANRDNTGDEFNRLFAFNDSPRRREEFVPAIDNFGMARSHQFNPGYFNPASTYLPWRKAQAPHWPDAVATAAQTEPRSFANSKTSPVFNLTAVVTNTLPASSEPSDTNPAEPFDFRNGMILPVGAVYRNVSCNTSKFGNGGSWVTVSAAVTTANRTVDSTCQMWIEYFPATYFLTTATSPDGNTAGTLIASAPGGKNNLYKFEIKPANYGSGAAYTTAIQNFANWFQYYRNRRLGTVGAMTHALLNQRDMRVGYFAINSYASATPTMQDVNDATQRGALFTSMTNLSYPPVTAQGTPNRQAVARMGQQFDTRTGTTAPVLKSCQVNAGMLFTDGYSNAGGTADSPGDSALGAPFQDSHSNTMADIASNYYEKTLRGTAFLTDKVDVQSGCPNPKLDCRNDLHMNFYGITLGAKADLYGKAPYIDNPATPDIDEAFEAAHATPPPWAAAGADNPEAVDEIWHATINGRGKFVNASNPLAVADAMTDIIRSVGDKEEPSGSQSVTGARLSAGSFNVTPAFGRRNDSKDWFGTLTANRINAADGTDGAVLWNATDPGKIPPHTSRNIWTATSNVSSTSRAGVKAFNVGGGVNAATIGVTAADLTAYGVTEQQVFDYLRGDTSQEGTKLRSRSTRLGDIVNSAPQIAAAKDDYGWALASGLSATARTAYTAYLTSNGPAGKKDRKSFVYVGANDGMMHAFDGSTTPCMVGTQSTVCATSTSGQETFAYVPNGVLSKTGQLANPDYDHQYYVDGGIAIGDVYSAAGWKTLLVGAAGAGGRSVFGLNVSTPDSFTATDVLWEITGAVDGELGHVLGEPVIAPLENGQWVALFGNGYNSVNSDPVLFVVDVMTGAVLAKLRPNDNDLINANGMGEIAAVDADDNGLVDTVYGGDLRGNVWKFSVNSSGAWSLPLGATTPLFVATDPSGVRQPITGGIEVSAGPGSGLSIFFGTGRYFVDGDNNSVGAQVQSLYGIWDDKATAISGRGALQAQSITTQVTASGVLIRNTTSNIVDYPTERGWVLDLKVGAAAGTGERFLGTPRLQNGKVFFTTFEALADECDPGGQNWLYSLDAVNGGAAMSQISLNASLAPAVCTGSDCGGIGLSTGGPVRETSVMTPPPPPLPGIGCVPGAPGCTVPTTPPIQRCTIVIRASGAPPLYLPRPCGRQSWRQVR